MVAGGLLLYVVFGFIVPSVVFRRMGRPEWTFVFSSLVAIAGVVAVYRYGVFQSGDELIVAELSVARAHADGRAAEVTSFVALQAPQSTSFDTRAFLDAPAGDEEVSLASGQVTLLHGWSYANWQGQKIKHPADTF